MKNIQNRTKLFLDSEFTGLHQNTTFISLALVDQDNNYFYAEFNDYEKTHIDQWLETNVLDNLLFNEHKEFILKENNSINIKNDTENILFELNNWLLNYDSIEIWLDVLAYDWVLFCNLYGHALNIPSNIYYIPLDLSTLFYIKNIDPDTSREEFVGDVESIQKINKHNALHDAFVIKHCVQKLL